MILTLPVFSHWATDQVKVLFIINELGNGGRERRLVQLIRYLDAHSDVKMMVALTREEIEYTDINDTRAEIRFMKNGSLTTRFSELKKLVAEFRPDIIHLWIETAMFCVAAPLLSRLYGSKFIAGFVADGNPLSRLPLYQRLSVRYAFRKADAIISNSKAGLIAKEAPLDKSFVVYNGFDPARLADVDSAAKRKELNISAKYLVVMCGRMEPAKDWESFVLLAEKAARTNEDVYFLGVAGRGAMVEDFRAMIRQKGLSNISFVTCRSDVMEIMAATDVSVLFTNTIHAEGVSNSIMESMAADVPVIATAGGGTAEIITSGEDGYIIEPKNVDMAYSRLMELLGNDDLRGAMGEKARQTIFGRFMLSEMGVQYYDIYSRLYGNH